MALPTISFNTATGSDTAASGAGPATAVTGTLARTIPAGGTRIGLFDDPDLSEVLDTGAHTILCQTISDQVHNKITAVFDYEQFARTGNMTNGSAVLSSYSGGAGELFPGDLVRVSGAGASGADLYALVVSDDGGGSYTLGTAASSSVTGGTVKQPKQVTVAISVTLSSSVSWAIGGTLRKLSDSWAKTLLEGNGASAGDAQPGWILEGQGSETLTTTLNIRGVSGNTTDGPIIIRAASGQTWTFTSATNSVALFTLTGTLSNGLQFHDLTFTHTAATRGPAFATGVGNCDNLVWRGCIWDGCLHAIRPTNTILTLNVLDSEIKNCTSTNGAIYYTGAGAGTLFLEDCDIHDNAGPGYETNNNAGMVISVDGVIFDSNPYGIRLTATSGNPVVTVAQSVFYNYTNDGIEIASGQAELMHLRNTIFWGGTGAAYGVQHAGDQDAATFRGYYETSCAFGNHSSGAVQNLPTGDNRIALTADPFTDGPNRNFTLNSTAGGGAALKQQAAPRAVNSQTNQGDVGVLGFEGAGGSGTDHGADLLLIGVGVEVLG